MFHDIEIDNVATDITSEYRYQSPLTFHEEDFTFLSTIVFSLINREILVPRHPALSPKREPVGGNVETGTSTNVVTSEE